MEEGSCAATPTSACARGRNKAWDQDRSQERQLVPFLRQALEYEIERQIDVLESGGENLQETRLFDSRERPHLRHALEGTCARLPLFPRARPACRWWWMPSGRTQIRQRMPELPDARRQRMIAEYALTEHDAYTLTATRALADQFEEAAERPRTLSGLPTWCRAN